MITHLILYALLGLLPVAQDLAKTGAVAIAQQIPILLYVSRSDCTFCRRFEKEQLGPLLNSGVYHGKILFLELVWDAQGPIVNFRGERVSRSQLAQALDAKLTPTLLFLDGDGNELSPGIIGYNPNDYFGYYFEAAIKNAIVQARTAEGLQKSAADN